jgi:hypothetical protein
MGLGYGCVQVGRETGLAVLPTSNLQPPTTNTQRARPSAMTLWELGVGS